ncbi:hypothetical protein A2U01_0098139, partial [Trifolium medium]|nr:hypothetical protein [Trifolium medium]
MVRRRYGGDATGFEETTATEKISRVPETGDGDV